MISRYLFTNVVWVFLWSTFITVAMSFGPTHSSKPLRSTGEIHRKLDVYSNKDDRRRLDDLLQNSLRCDESKCLSSGPEAIVNRTEQLGGTSGVFVSNSSSPYYLHRFDCYYRPQNDEPMLCADGYNGVPIDASIEPPRMISSENFLPRIPVLQHYYTCCLGSTANGIDANEGGDIIEEESRVRRHCSDPKKILEIDNDENTTNALFDPMPCNDGLDDGRIFPRPMTKSSPFYHDTYVCCDEEQEEEVILDESVVSSTAEAPSNRDELCDESRCLGRAIGEFLPGYGCWAEGPEMLNPYACSDGYIGIPVSQTDQPPLFDETQFLTYYTCCPPSFASTQNNNTKEASAPRRHCSDPIDYQPENTTELLCHDSKLKYPRKQNNNGHFWFSLRKPNVNTESYVCCDVELPTEPQDENMENEGTQIAYTNSGSKSFLEEAECIPSCDPGFIYDCFANNKYGFLWPMGCEDPNGEFVEPKLIGQGWAMGGTRFFYKYGCCKKGFGSGPFIQDRAFNLTVWPQLILSSLSVIASVLLIVALLLSFWTEGNDGAADVKSSTYNSSSGISIGNNSATKSKSIFSSLRSSLRKGRGSTASTAASKRKTMGKTNSAYNVYLVYLAVPDTILNLYVVGMYGSYVNQKFNPDFSSYIINSIFHERKTAFDMALILACSAANLYLNAIISYELFTMLKNSHRRKRTPPPTFRRVGLQAAGVYAWSICIFLIRYFVEEVNKNKDKVGIPKWLEVTLYFVISAGIPIVYLCYVCVVIWRRKLLPSIKGPLRVLAMYFFRIILVFILLWLPGVLLLSFACGWEWDNAGDVDYNDVLYPIGLIFCSIQPIVSTGMALTKPDVRMAFLRLLRLSYCRDESHGDAIETQQGTSLGKKGIKGEEITKDGATNPQAANGVLNSNNMNSSLVKTAVTESSCGQNITDYDAVSSMEGSSAFDKIVDEEAHDTVTSQN